MKVILTLKAFAFINNVSGASSHLFFSARRYILDWLYCLEVTYSSLFQYSMFLLLRCSLLEMLSTV